jgi:hypothetical protein
MPLASETFSHIKPKLSIDALDMVCVKPQKRNHTSLTERMALEKTRMVDNMLYVSRTWWPISQIKLQMLSGNSHLILSFPYKILVNKIFQKCPANSSASHLGLKCPTVQLAALLLSYKVLVSAVWCGTWGEDRIPGKPTLRTTSKHQQSPSAQGSAFCLVPCTCFLSWYPIQCFALKEIHA